MRIGRILVGVDALVLLDPLAKEFDLPAAAIQVGDAQCGQAKLIGQKYDAFVDLRIYVLDATERNGKPFVRILATQNHRLIADQTGRPIHGMRVATLRRTVLSIAPSVGEARHLMAGSSLLNTKERDEVSA